MFENSTVYNINYGELFVGVPGVVVAGWVGFGLFIAAFLLTWVLLQVNYIRMRADAFEIAAYAAAMVVVYLLGALEQFVMLREDQKHVNLLMAVVNGVVWLWVVLGPIRVVDLVAVPMVPTYERKYALGLGIGAQVMYVAACLCWGGVIFFLWAAGLVLMLLSLMHYVVRIGNDWPVMAYYTRAWLIFSLAYTGVYVLLAFLSHLFLGVMSLPAAMWTYLMLHLVGFVALVWFQRMRTAPTGVATLATQFRQRAAAQDEVSISPNGLTD